MLSALKRWLSGAQIPCPEPLMWLNGRDAITLPQAHEHILLVGASGSGKTTTMAHIIAGLMAYDCGMLVLTSKRTDMAMIERLAEETGRLGDLREVAPGNGYCFEPLTDELTSYGGSLATAQQYLVDLNDVVSRADSLGASESFWPINAGFQQKHAIAAIFHATGRCRPEDLHRFIMGLPTSREMRDSEEWKRGYTCQTLSAALCKYPKGQEPTDLVLAAEYVMDFWSGLSDRTSSSITAHSLALTERLLSGDVRDLVNGQTNLSPQDILDGRIVVVNTPTLVFRESGRLVQACWKLSTIRSVLRRDLSVNSRPVAIIADEAQEHAMPRVDSSTLAVARSHKLLICAATQNRPLVVSALKSEEECDAWMSLFNTKLLFANSDKETNEYFSDLLGHSKHLFMGGSNGSAQWDPISEWMGTAQPQASASFNEQWHPDVPPETFAGPRMRKGGAANGFFVDFYVHQAGRRFSNGKSWIKACARQKL